MASGTAGMKAEPSCRRQAMLPTSLTAALAQKPDGVSWDSRWVRKELGLLSHAVIGCSRTRRRVSGHAETSDSCHVPRKMPKAVQSCQPITRAPRIFAGATEYQHMCPYPCVKLACPAHYGLGSLQDRPCKEEYSRSAAYIGTVAALAPIPMPRTKRTANNASHEWVKPEAMGVAMRMSEVMKISPRRPR